MMLCEVSDLLKPDRENAVPTTCFQAPESLRRAVTARPRSPEAPVMTTVEELVMARETVTVPLLACKSLHTVWFIRDSMKTCLEMSKKIPKLCMDCPLFFADFIFNKSQ